MSGQANETAETPRPWPEYAYPTAEQFADWYPSATQAERVKIAGQLLADSEQAHGCFMQNHASLGNEVQFLRSCLRDVEAQLDAAKVANTAVYVAAERASRKGYDLDPDEVLDLIGPPEGGIS